MITLDTLIIEVTRKCNMQCDHCLRGEAQRSNIDHSYITSLLENVSYISSLTFSGGEPSLNVKAIQFTLQELVRLNISVNNFYIVTNGSKTSMNKAFIDVCCDLYRYQDDREDMGRYLLEMSDDYYHDQDLHQEVVDYLSIYTFFRVRGNNYTNDNLIKQGRQKRGRDLYVDSDLDVEFSDYDDSEFRILGDLYLNTKGLITTNCDMSYINQDKNHVCHVSELMNYLDGRLKAYQLDMVS